MEHDHGRHQLAELLDRDAEVLHSYLSDVTAWVRQHAAGQPRRVLDLGAGTGTGTIALARCFAAADVIAVDQSADMLARIRCRAGDLGLAGRVITVQADLDRAWPAIEPVDVAWASNVLHELASPRRVLADAFAALRPGGLLAVAELGAPPRFLPDDLGLGRPGLEARCHAALEHEAAAREPEPAGLAPEHAGPEPEPAGLAPEQAGPEPEPAGLAPEQAGPEPEPAGLAGGSAGAAPRLDADWGPRLAEAGFAQVTRRTFIIELTPPLPAGTARYAQAYLRRIRPVLEGRLDVGDLAVLDTLIDSDGPDGLLRRADLSVRGTRTAWIGRRAAP
jgi:SAM-dependent methyltransferase